MIGPSRSQVVFGCVVAFSLNCSTGAFAAPIIEYNSSGEATGVADLAVDGVLFDVDFLDGSYDSVYATEEPFFLGDPTGGNAAIVALGDALIANSVSTIAGIPGECGGSIPRCEILVPILVGPPYPPGIFEFLAVGLEGSSFWTPIGGAFPSSIDLEWQVFTRFTPVAVPEPSTFILIGASLTVLGMRPSRRHQQR
jgi:hypothetical protein